MLYFELCGNIHLHAILNVTSSLLQPFLLFVNIIPILPPIHFHREEECEDSTQEEEVEEEEETPVTESDSDEKEGANQSTSRYFRTRW